MDYARAPHAELYMRRYRATDPETQNMLAAYEHRAFAREAVGENPLMAVPIALAAPLYQLQKAAGLSGARSKPSLNQLLQGWTGVAEGVRNALTR